MSDRFEEVTTRSWGKKIIDSFVGVIIGILLVIGSVPLIFWNEGNSVKRAKTLNTGLSSVIAIPSDRVDASKNGKLVHISGRLTADTPLQDVQFGIQADAIKLRRVVEMYQWHEETSSKTEKNLGGSETTTTVYNYTKNWSSEAINSSNFRHPQNHRNPPLPFTSENFSAADAQLGAFRLTEPFIAQVDNFTDFPLVQGNYDALSPNFKREFQLYQGRYYTGSPNAPEIGALRIGYKIAPATDASVVGQQNGARIETYYTRNGTIALLETSQMSANEMFSAAARENALLTWLLRFGALLMMWIGLAMILRPLVAIADVVPFIGGLLGAGISIITGIIALPTTIILIALAWLVFRPLIAIVLLVVAGGVLFGGIKLLAMRRAALKRAAET